MKAKAFLAAPLLTFPAIGVKFSLLRQTILKMKKHMVHRELMITGGGV